MILIRIYAFSLTVTQTTGWMFVYILNLTCSKTIFTKTKGKIPKSPPREFPRCTKIVQKYIVIGQDQGLRFNKSFFFPIEW